MVAELEGLRSKNLCLRAEFKQVVDFLRKQNDELLRSAESQMDPAATDSNHGIAAQIATCTSEKDQVSCPHSVTTNA